MEKQDSIAEQEAMALPRGLYGMDHHYEEWNFLLFLIDQENLQLKGRNLRAKNFLGEETSQLSGQRRSFMDFVHPGDHEKLHNYLNSSKSRSSVAETEVRLRLKQQSGNWQEISLSHRPYLGKLQNCLLVIAKENPKGDPLRWITTESGSEEKRPDKYQTVINSLDEGFCIIELIFDEELKPLDYLYLETNPAFQKQSGLPTAEGRTMLEMVPGRENIWFEIYGKVALFRKPKRFQQFTESMQSSWFNVYAFPVGAAEHPQVAVLFANVTKTKLAEAELKEVNNMLEQKVELRTKELQENAELLQIIFDTTKDGIVVYKPVFEGNDLVDFEYLRVNKIVRDQYHQRPLEGHRFLEVNPQASELKVFQKFKHTMLTGEEKDFELFYEIDGSDTWFRITARRQKDLLICTVEDITRRKLESQRLKDSIRFKKHLTRTSPDIIMIFNLYDESIRYINRDLAPVPGMRKKDILGRKLMEIISFIHPRDREKAMEFHQKIREAQDSDILEMEFRLRTARGQYLWFNLLGKIFMRNKNAKVYEYMILLRNIDEQKATQKALINAEKLSIKGEIARTLAHELRNPLASIGMATDIMSKKKPGETSLPDENIIEIIKRNTEILNELVTDLLTSSNYSPVVLKKSCLAETLENSLKLAQDRIYLSGITVKKEYQGNYYINADEEKLKIALLNIIVNASEAMEPEEGILELRIEKKEDEFTLTVTDNGCGLEKEQMDKLFDAFYTHRPNGIGVGLNSVKTILEEHDAKIKVESEPNKGTTFLLSFPCLGNFERS